MRYTVLYSSDRTDQFFQGAMARKVQFFTDMVAQELDGIGRNTNHQSHFLVGKIQAAVLQNITAHR